MSELKPCPFCGEENTDTGFILHKDECYLMLRYMGGHSKQEMINAWNTRPIEDALQAEIDRRDEKIAELTATTHSQALRNAELLRFVWWVYQVYARNVQELTSGITEACTYKTEEKAEKGKYGLPIRCWKYIRYLEEYTAGIYNGTYLDSETSMDAKKGIPENKPAYNENANSLLRSAWMIANRNGEETNWEAFKNAVYKELVAEHNVKNSTDNNKGE